MASVEEVETEILNPMRALYRVPHGVEDPTAALVEYAKVLCRFEYFELVRAWQHLTIHHKRRDWPSIPDINDAIRVTKPVDVDAPSARPTYRADNEPDTRTPESKDRVRRMMAVLDRHKAFSETPFSDTANDPEYLAIVEEFERAEVARAKPRSYAE